MWFNFNSGELKSNEGGTLAIINLCDLPLHLFCTFEKYCIVKKFGSQNETGSYSMGTVINPHGWKWPDDIDSAKPSKYSTTKWDIFPGQNSMGSDFVVTSVDLFNYMYYLRLNNVSIISEQYSYIIPRRSISTTGGTITSISDQELSLLSWMICFV